jgi:hypothetical protein
MTRLDPSIVKRALGTLALALAPLGMAVLAQPIGGPPPCWPPPCVPIDGGISLLAAAGLAYGGHKAWQLRKGASKP